MNTRLVRSSLCVLGLALLPLHAKPAKTKEEEIVKLDPYVVEMKSLADAGFTIKAKFLNHLIGAGIKELIIVKVGPQSDAKKAGLAVGEKILQIRDVKVEGLGIKELQDEFAAKAVDGKVTLLVQSKGSDETRTVELPFTKSALLNGTSPRPSETKAPAGEAKR
ncbi:MAG: PDZ domain-containing protein [Opitutus sp.]